MIPAIEVYGTRLEAFLAARYGVDMRDDTGAMSLQWAVVAAFMVFIAIAVAAIMLAKAKSQAENIPDVVQKPGP